MSESSDGTVLLNVCIIPSSQVGAECVKISQSLKSEGTLFTLGGDKFAHMTVYMARFPEYAIGQVEQAVKTALKESVSFRCVHTGYFMTGGNYLEVSYKKTDEFLSLQSTLIAAASPLRANPGSPKQESYYAPYIDEQRKNAEETGYDLAGNLYRPHITLTRYADGKVPEEFPAFPSAKLSFNLSTVAVYKADDNGAVYEELARFTL